MAPIAIRAVPTTERTTSGLIRDRGLERLRAVERRVVVRVERGLVGRLDGAAFGLRLATA
jgi:hypothetical protein